jgi:hypothetical protein
VPPASPAESEQAPHRSVRHSRFWKNEQILEFFFEQISVRLAKRDELPSQTLKPEEKPLADNAAHQACFVGDIA